MCKIMKERTENPRLKLALSLRSNYNVGTHYRTRCSLVLTAPHLVKLLQTAQSASKALKIQDRVKPDKAKRSRFSRGVCTRRLFHGICFYIPSPGGGTGGLDLELAACWEEPALEAPGVRFSCCCFPNATKNKSAATNPMILTVTPSPTVSELRCSSKKRLPRMELAVQMSHVSPAEDPKSKKIHKAKDAQSKKIPKAKDSRKSLEVHPCTVSTCS